MNSQTVDEIGMHIDKFCIKVTTRFLAHSLFYKGIIRTVKGVPEGFEFKRSWSEDDCVCFLFGRKGLGEPDFEEADITWFNPEFERLASNNSCFW